MALRWGASSRGRAPAALVMGAALLAWLQVAAAVEFRSVGVPATILYDAPSLKARRLYILNQSYPVEVVVTLEGWYKVRDASGGLALVGGRGLPPPQRGGG